MGAEIYAKRMPSDLCYTGSYGGLLEWHRAMAKSLGRDAEIMFDAWVNDDGEHDGMRECMIYVDATEEELTRLGFVNMRWYCAIGRFKAHWTAQHEADSFNALLETTLHDIIPIIGMKLPGRWTPKECERLADTLDSMNIEEVPLHEYVTPGKPIVMFDMNERMKSAMRWCRKNRVCLWCS